MYGIEGESTYDFRQLQLFHNKIFINIINIIKFYFGLQLIFYVCNLILNHLKEMLTFDVD
jgi:hypothetical protein